MDVDILSKVKEYLANKYNYKIHKLTPSTSLLKDLNLYGDELEDLLWDFCETFEIPLENIHLDNFNIGDIYLLEFWKNWNKRTITIQDLINAIERREYFINIFLVV
ncbi:DUF1493 family protein [Spirosoma koreense]